jgi:hypothetical protein
MNDDERDDLGEAFLEREREFKEQEREQEIPTPAPEQPAPTRAVCGVVFFVKPGGQGVVIHPLTPESGEPVERVATATDIRGILADVGAKMQADYQAATTMAAFARAQQQAQDQMINDQIANAALKGNGRRGLGLVEGLRDRFGRKR